MRGVTVWKARAGIRLRPRTPTPIRPPPHLRVLLRRALVPLDEDLPHTHTRLHAAHRLQERVPRPDDADRRDGVRGRRLKAVVDTAWSSHSLRLDVGKVREALLGQDAHEAVGRGGELEVVGVLVAEDGHERLCRAALDYDEVRVEACVVGRVAARSTSRRGGGGGGRGARGECKGRGASSEEEGGGGDAVRAGACGRRRGEGKGRRLRLGRVERPRSTPAKARDRRYAWIACRGKEADGIYTFVRRP